MVSSAGAVPSGLRFDAGLCTESGLTAAIESRHSSSRTRWYASASTACVAESSDTHRMPCRLAYASLMAAR
jgi:hypothetical protein